MPQTCSICVRRERSDIEKALLEKRPLRNIAVQFDTSTGALQRHKPHIVQALARTHTAREIAKTETVLSDVVKAYARAERLYDTTQEILARATSSKEEFMALRAIKTSSDLLNQTRGFLELRGQLTGELGKDSRPEKNGPTLAELEKNIVARLNSLLIDPLPGDAVIDVSSERLD